MTGTPARPPDALAALLDVPFTDEQLTAITAPLEPGSRDRRGGLGQDHGDGGSGRVAGRHRPGAPGGGARADLHQQGGRRARGADPHGPRRAAEPAESAPVAPEGGAGATELPVEGEPTVATYHAYAGRLLRDHGLRIGVEPGARLLADATRFQLAERVLRRAAGPFEALDKTVSSLVGDVVALDGELSEHLVSSQRMRAHDQALRAEIAALPKRIADVAKASEAALQRIELSQVIDDVRAEKVRLGVLDFGDQLAEAVRLVRSHPAVVEAERERYRVVLLDEYQDTSVAQKVLLAALFGDGHPVTAVGDPCQAIYGWRGASVGNIDAFPVDFPRADGAPAARFDLAQNNRSGGLLLRLANTLSVDAAGATPRAARARAPARGGGRGTYGRRAVRAAGRGGRLGGRRRGPPGGLARAYARATSLSWSASGPTSRRTTTPSSPEGCRSRSSAWGAARPARGRRPGGHPRRARRLHGQRLARAAAHRSPLADRAARPRAAGQAGRRPGRHASRRTRPGGRC